MISRSPSFGMQDMCLITQPPTVVAPFIRKGTRHSALWARIIPGILTEPSGRYSTFSPERMNSSSMSPTISPSRRSSVTSPTNFPYSFSTKASLAFSSRNWDMSISTVCISITHGTWRSMERKGGRTPFSV